MYTNFDKTNLSKIRKEVEAVLRAYGEVKNISFDIGTIRFTNNTFKMGVEAKVATVQKSGGSSVDPVVDQACFNYNLVAERGSVKLIDYKPRNHKYPFIILKNGKRLKTSVEQIKNYLSA